MGHLAYVSLAYTWHMTRMYDMDFAQDHPRGRLLQREHLSPCMGTSNVETTNIVEDLPPVIFFRRVWDSLLIDRAGDPV